LTLHCRKKLLIPWEIKDLSPLANSQSHPDLYPDLHHHLALLSEVTVFGPRHIILSTGMSKAQNVVAKNGVSVLNCTHFNVTDLQLCLLQKFSGLNLYAMHRPTPRKPPCVSGAT
jgi:hypothetical protein